MKYYANTGQRFAASPMTRQEYNDARGWTVPDDENPNDYGVLLEHIGIEANSNISNCYVSWIPYKVFSENYTVVEQE